jgi:prepilin-type N-terminal cleavage/methylation domain-containing protein
MELRKAAQKSGPRRPEIPGQKPPLAEGFTLTEVIAVLAIIAILATAVLGVGRYAMKRARIGKAKATLEKLALAIGLYKEDFGGYIPDTVQSENGNSLRVAIDKLRWSRTYTDALGRKRSKPSPNDYDKPSEILFFFLQEMYDVMNQDQGSRQANRSLLANLPRKQAYVHFKKNELADTDHDGLPEIVDGWGMPFLYVAKDKVRGDSAANIEPHEGKNPESFSLYSFGPDKLGYYRGTKRDEQDYPVGDLDFNKRTDSADQAEMRKRIKDFGDREGYTGEEALKIANKENLTNWQREE